MKLVLLAGLICAFYLFQAINAAPVGAESVEAQLPELEEQRPSVVSRQKRATCDLLSGFGLNHSACAFHCLLRGNRGGYCSDKAVCICRK
ncbi:sapecin-like [Zeugodacus cucurbitae]|uniref:sapecin-like n=1 Tax=Zeugodacus cucurbitae TaxID=28588 RepID=UPI000596A64E|nr:sapecin-like [Zeugodacus cucurbitae]